MKTRHRFSPLGGAKRVYCWIRTAVLVKLHEILVQIRGRRPISRGMGTPKRLRWKELKQWAERNEKGPPNDRPRHILFRTKRGEPSVIGFSNYFLRGEFRHVRTQHHNISTASPYHCFLDNFANTVMISSETSGRGQVMRTYKTRTFFLAEVFI